MKSPLLIGDRIMPTRAFLSPLAGYTQLPFRRAIRELGGLGLATTDLVHATELLADKKFTRDLIVTTPDDCPLSIQIYGAITGRLVTAAQWLADRGYEGIDLNMGCPMSKVNGQGGGAKLMCDTDGAARMAAEVVKAVSIPVTVKMRLGWDRSNITAPRLARRLEEIGVAAITVHGRTRQQGFQGSIHHDAIAQTVQAVRSIPVIANGDVRTVGDALTMRRLTGCAAIAIGRGAMLDPWIFRKIADVDAGQEPREPTPDEQIQFLVRHFTLMTEQHGERSCILFRKFAAWYGVRLGIPDDLEHRLRQLADIDAFSDLVAEIRDRHGERQSMIPTALLKTPNGPVELW
jgi:tRNA-dihydrouridine synthase B